jgi:hypothetical protein
MGMLRRGAVVTAVAMVALATTAGVAAGKTKTVSDQVYAARVCGEIAKVLEPLQELRGVDSADYATYQEQAMELLDEASAAAEDARDSLERVTSKSGGKKAAHTWDFFFNERAGAFEDASDQFNILDADDETFDSQLDLFLDVLNDSPFGINDPFGASTITKKKALAKAFEDDETCVAVRVEFD